MKHALLSTASCCLVATLAVASRSEASTTVFADDFSSSSIVNQGNPYVGGWFTPQLAFQQWTSTLEAAISDGGLDITTTNSTRSAGIVISPELFDGAGDYVLKFDISSYVGAANNSALVTVWSGSGYDLGGTSENSITVDTYTASLVATGSAEVMQLAATTLTTVSTDHEINFTYDGISAVAVFLGATTIGWPFPSATYDNVLISKFAIEPIPEPSTTLFVGASVMSLLMIRRRVS